MYTVKNEKEYALNNAVASVEMEGYTRQFQFIISNIDWSSNTYSFIIKEK